MNRGIKAIIYGVPGVGKTTFAAQFPAPYILDLERGAERYDVPHNSDIETFSEFRQVLATLPPGTGTVIIDTFDELEKMIVQHVMNRENVDSLNKIGGGYGRGWLAVYEQFGQVISDLDRIRIKHGMNIVLVGHSTIKHFEPADSAGYDRYTFACYEKNNDMLRRWSDITLFARFDSIVVEDGQNAKVKSNGKRVAYTVSNPCWDAKSRWKLPEKIPFEFSAIASILTDTASGANKVPGSAPAHGKAPETPTASGADAVTRDAAAQKPVEPATAPETPPLPPDAKPGPNPNAEQVENIRKLCAVSHLDEATLMQYITKRGVVPAGMQLDNLAVPVLKRIENGFNAIYKNIKNGY